MVLYVKSVNTAVPAVISMLPCSGDRVCVCFLGFQEKKKNHTPIKIIDICTNTIISYESNGIDERNKIETNFE